MASTKTVLATLLAATAVAMPVSDMGDVEPKMAVLSRRATSHTLQIRWGRGTNGNPGNLSPTYVDRVTTTTNTHTPSYVDRMTTNTYSPTYVDRARQPGGLTSASYMDYRGTANPTPVTRWKNPALDKAGFQLGQAGVKLGQDDKIYQKNEQYLHNGLDMIKDTKSELHGAWKEQATDLSKLQNYNYLEKTGDPLARLAAQRTQHDLSLADNKITYDQRAMTSLYTGVGKEKQAVGQSYAVFKQAEKKWNGLYSNYLDVKNGGHRTGGRY